MDFLGVIFLILFLLVLTISNVAFYRGINKAGNKDYKHMVSFFFICIITPAIIFIFYFIFETSVLIDVLKFEITDTYTERIAKLSVILPLNIIVNYFLVKLYLRKITKNKNEIELIGTE